jgi:hypothetical protein
VASARHSRQLLIALFAFFYVPVTYHYGAALLPRVLEDFPSYYHAARLAFVEGKTPYGFHAFDPITAELGRKVHPYLYPPPSLLAFWPFAKMSYAGGQALFILASHLCFLGSIWLILTKLTPQPRDERLREVAIALSIVYLLSFHPALATLGIGQVNHLAMAFICLALAGLKSGGPAWRIALPLSIAILLKTYPVLLLGLLFFRGKYAAIALTCAFFGALTGIAALALSAEVWTTWFAEVLPAGGYANEGISAAGPWNQNVNGFVTRLLLDNKFSDAPLDYPSLAKPIATGLVVIVAAVTALLSFRVSRRADYERHADDETAAFLLMIFLIAPLSWDHHLVYILPAAVFAISLLVRGSVRGTWATIALIAALFLIAWQSPFDHPALMRGWWTLLISMKFYPVLVLWVFFINRLRHPAVAPLQADLPAHAHPQATR